MLSKFHHALSDPPSESKNKQRFSRIRKGAIALALLLVLTTASGYGGYMYRSTLVGTTRVTVSPSSQAVARSAEIPKTTNIIGDVKFEHTGVKGYVEYTPVQVSLSAPVESRPQVVSFPQCDRDVSLSCLKVSMANILGKPISDQGVNSITVYPLTDWLKHNSPLSTDQPYTFGRIKDNKTKAIRYEALTSINSNTIITPSDITDKYLNPFATNAAQSGISDIHYIEAGSGKFKGFRYVSSLLQNYGYRPDAYFVLCGSVSDIPVVIFGNFQINDATKLSVQAIQDRLNRDGEMTNDQRAAAAELEAFANTYVAGYNYASDTRKQAAEAAAIVSSLSIK